MWDLSCHWAVMEIHAEIQWLEGVHSWRLWDIGDRTWEGRDNVTSMYEAWNALGSHL